MSTQETAFFIALLMLLLVILPYFVEKYTGNNPLKILKDNLPGSWFDGLLGRKNSTSGQTGKTGTTACGLFGRKGSAAGKSGFAGTSSEAGNGASNGKSSAAGNGQEGKAGAGKDGNGTQNDLMTMVSKLLNYTRRNHFQIIIPGTIAADGEKAAITVIMITRSRIIGVNCYGYGGTLQIAAGENDWTQTLNGQRHKIDSPVRKNQQKYEVLRRVQTAASLEDIPSEVIGIFTTPGVLLKGGTGSRCFTRKTVMEYLESPHVMADEKIDPKATAKKLEPYLVKEKKQK